MFPPPLPIAIKLEGCRVLLVGAGVVGGRRLDALLDAGAQIDLVAPQCSREVEQRIATNASIEWRREAYRSDHMQADYTLVVAATNDQQVNRAVADDARKAKVLVNVVDDAEESNVYFGGRINRDHLTLGIYSGGQNPALVAALRSYFERILPADLGKQSVNLEATAADANTSIRDGSSELVNSSLGEQASIGFQLRDMLERLQNSEPARISFVGAGIRGEKDLSIEALEVLASADYVLADRLVHPEVKKFARRDSEWIDVGKPGISQKQINQKLRELGKENVRIVRLKGGDPAIFARLTEEVQVAQEIGVKWKIIPGVSAGSAAAAVFGMSLSSREVATGVVFLTAHTVPVDDSGKERRFTDETAAILRQCATLDTTLVLYMGVASSDLAVKTLLEAGAQASTPAVAAIHIGRDDETLVTSTLASLGDDMRKVGATSPAIICIGSGLLPAPTS